MYSVNRYRDPADNPRNEGELLSMDNDPFVPRCRYEEEVRRRKALEGELEAVRAERTASNKALHQALKNERELVKIKMNFIASISHEFRTPLTKMDGAAHRIMKIVNRGDDCGEKAMVIEQCDAVRRNVEVIAKLIEKCLTVNLDDAKKA